MKNCNRPPQLSTIQPTTQMTTCHLRAVTTKYKNNKLSSKPPFQCLMTINEEHYSHIPLRQQASSRYTTRCQVKTWEAFLRISIPTTQLKTTPHPLEATPSKSYRNMYHIYQSDNTSAIILTSHATINPNNQPHKSIPPHKSQNLLKRKWSLKNIFKFLLQWQVATLNQEPPQIFFKVHTFFHPMADKPT